jgi:hypothetical protein
MEGRAGEVATTMSSSYLEHQPTKPQKPLSLPRSRQVLDLERDGEVDTAVKNACQDGLIPRSRRS